LTNFVTSLLLCYYYKHDFWCLRDEQAAYKIGSVHVKPKAHHLCHNTYITIEVYC